MGKVIGFELKKLVSRMGIYILVVLLAGVLVAGAFMYKPKENTPPTYSLVGETVSDMYANFNNNLKPDAIDSVEEIALNASTYMSSSTNYVKYNDPKQVNSVWEAFDNYCLLYNESDATDMEYATLLVGIRQSLQNLVDVLNNNLFNAQPMKDYYILTTNQNYQALQSVITKTEANFNSNATREYINRVYFNELRAPLHEKLQQLIYPNLEKTAIKYTNEGTYYTLTTSRMEEIALKMQAEHQKVVDNPSLENDKAIKNTLNALLNRYMACIDTFTNLYSSSMYVNALSSTNNKSIRADMYGYKDISFYEQEEKQIKYQYFIENNVTASNFASALSVTHTSSGKINAYDFTFFVMSLFAVVVMLFAIYLSAHTISGEINNNTMRLTAIRPIKRSSLFLGKYFAILIMCLILLLFGTITSLIVGGILYGFNSANILMVINTEFIFIAHPLAVICIFVLSLLLTIMVYSAFTIMLSAIFKSDLLAMIVGVVLYGSSMILPLFFGMSSWLRFYPFTNLNLFSYFGTTKLTSDSVLAKLFNSVVYQGMNLWISLIYVLGITTLLLLIGKQIFKKREL